MMCCITKLFLFAFLLIGFVPDSEAGRCKPYPQCQEILNDPQKWASENEASPDNGQLDLADIVSNSVNASCLAWRPTGVCFWLKIKLFSVSVRTSLKVKHYIPDLVISAYQNKGKNTWDMMSWTDDISDSVAGGFGLELEGGDTVDKRQGFRAPVNLKFKHGTAIGNPLASVYGQSYMDYVMCQSGVTSFMPYFNSIADGMMWRTATPEIYTNILDILTPGKSNIGERNDGDEYLFTGVWSGLYPRTGFVNHSDDYKAAATVAARVASIVTSSPPTHIAMSANGSSKSGYWPAGEVDEWDSVTGKWQMLYPKMDDQCHLFGHISTSLIGDDGYSDRRDSGGNYAWNLWREYSCCRKEGQVFLGFVGE